MRIRSISLAVVWRESRLRGRRRGLAPRSIFMKCVRSNKHRRIAPIKLAEIVCSNSLKSDEAGTASYLLKEELRRGDSLVMAAAAETRVPAGAALAVDREKFAELITRRIERRT